MLLAFTDYILPPTIWLPCGFISTTSQCPWGIKRSYSGQSLPSLSSSLRRSRPGLPTLASPHFRSCTPLNLQDVFLVVEISQRTLQRLKLYFQNRYDVVTPTHWLLMDGPDLELPELRSLDLRYNDPLSRSHSCPSSTPYSPPSLVSLTVHDFGGCPDADTPSADLVTLPAPSRVPVLVQPNAQPLDHFLATLVHAVPNPDVLASLRFTDLDCFASCALEHPLDYLGPDLRELRVSKCSPEMLDAFVASVSCGEFRWILKRLTIRGMDTDELLESVWIRHAITHERLEVVCEDMSCRERLMRSDGRMYH
ncbi:hypothetical protein B0H14DRAFT_3888997 [Mycena olivaceomarginata]|nr:hypothetical protein B0H14DRAFT_3888997 [Mycena olivaceomarginata]